MLYSLQSSSCSCFLELTDSPVNQRNNFHFQEFLLQWVVLLIEVVSQRPLKPECLNPVLGVRLSMQIHHSEFPACLLRIRPLFSLPPNVPSCFQSTGIYLAHFKNLALTVDGELVRGACTRNRKWGLWNLLIFFMLISLCVKLPFLFQHIGGVFFRTLLKDHILEIVPI